MASNKYQLFSVEEYMNSMQDMFRQLDISEEPARTVEERRELVEAICSENERVRDRGELVLMAQLYRFITKRVNAVAKEYLRTHQTAILDLIQECWEDVFNSIRSGQYQIEFAFTTYYHKRLTGVIRAFIELETGVKAYDVAKRKLLKDARDYLRDHHIEPNIPNLRKASKIVDPKHKGLSANLISELQTTQPTFEDYDSIDLLGTPEESDPKCIVERNEKSYAIFRAIFGDAKRRPLLTSMEAEVLMLRTGYRPSGFVPKLQVSEIAARTGLSVDEVNRIYLIATNTLITHVRKGFFYDSVPLDDAEDMCDEIIPRVMFDTDEAGSKMEDAIFEMLELDEDNDDSEGDESMPPLEE